LACDDACLSIRLAVDDRRACSHARVLEQRGGLSLLEVDIETGRKHQIRKHMAAISCPVQGDRLHGLAEKTSEVNLQLSATRLSFVCPFTHEARCYQLPESLMLSL
jgi:tRNA pseudouridine32 synthase/23S rRNA pseudouridine746 synthase